MTQMRELEQIHNEKLQDIAVSTLEKIMKNELPDDLPDDVRMVSGYFQRVCDILQFQSPRRHSMWWKTAVFQGNYDFWQNVFFTSTKLSKSVKKAVNNLK